MQLIGEFLIINNVKCEITGYSDGTVSFLYNGETKKYKLNLAYDNKVITFDNVEVERQFLDARKKEEEFQKQLTEELKAIGVIQRQKFDKHIKDYEKAKEEYTEARRRNYTFVKLFGKLLKYPPYEKHRHKFEGRQPTSGHYDWWDYERKW